MRRAIKYLWAAAATVVGAAGTAEAADFVYPQSGRCTSNYYSSRPYGYHGALDIAGPNGSAITAARDGRISYYGWSGGYGNLMIVSHSDGYTTYYAHLSGKARSVGSSVQAGDTIAYEGSTGHSSGPHVHFEVRRYGTKQFVPGSVGSTFTRGHGLPYDYSGLSGAAQYTQSAPTQQAPAGAVDNRAWKVTTSALNVRAEPNASASSMGVVRSGQVYIGERSHNGWRRIWFDGRAGWSHGDYLSAARGVIGEIVTADVLNVRNGPSTRNNLVGTARKGQRYIRADTQGAWVKIYFDGTGRWVHRDFLRGETY